MFVNKILQNIIHFSGILFDLDYLSDLLIQQFFWYRSVHENGYTV